MPSKQPALPIASIEIQARIAPLFSSSPIHTYTCSGGRRGVCVNGVHAMPQAQRSRAKPFLGSGKDRAGFFGESLSADIFLFRVSKGGTGTGARTPADAPCTPQRAQHSTLQATAVMSWTIGCAAGVMHLSAPLFIIIPWHMPWNRTLSG